MMKDNAVAEPTIAYLYSNIVSKLSNIIDNEYSMSKDAATFLMPSYFLIRQAHAIMIPFLSEENLKDIEKIQKEIPNMPRPTNLQESQSINYFDSLMEWLEVLQVAASNADIISVQSKFQKTKYKKPDNVMNETGGK